MLIVEFFRLGQTINQLSNSEIIDWSKALSIIIGSITLLIVIKQYRNKDASKTFTKLQIEAVMKMLEEMRKVEFVMHPKSNTQLPSLVYRVSDNKRFFNQLYKPWLDNYKLYFDNGFFQEWKFFSYRSDYFIPDAIAKELKKFEDGFQVTPIDITNETNLIRATAPNTTITFDRVYSYHNPNQPFTNLTTFVNHFKEVERVSQKWLKENFKIQINVD